MKVNRKEVRMKDGFQPSFSTNNCHNNFTYSNLKEKKVYLNCRNMSSSSQTPFPFFVKMLVVSTLVLGFMGGVCVGLFGTIHPVFAAPDLSSQDRFQEELVDSDFDSDLYTGGDGMDSRDGSFAEGKFQLTADDIQVHQHKIPSNSEDDVSLDSKNPLFPVNSNPNGGENFNGVDVQRVEEEEDVFAGPEQG